MKILVYGINYSPELTGIGKYTGEMVEWLAAQGHEVRVITAPPYYPQWQVGENYSAWRYKREEGAATVWRCPLYVPKQPSTLKRLLHLGSFAVSSFFPLMAQRRWKPDRIIGVVPTLFCTPGMRLLAKLSGARTVLHIQDYEVDAMLGLGLAGKGKGGKVAQLDCHLVVQKRGAADAVLPSKLTNILAVGGNAVITAEAHTELGQLCETFPGIAVCVEPESVEALVAGICQALLLPKHNTVAREYAERTLDKENVLRQFINDIRG